MKMNKYMEQQRGSALILILVGIVLFAAVSYTVTQGMRVSSDSKGLAMGAQEKTNLAVTDLMQFLEAVKMRVFQLSNAGVQATQIDFRNDVYMRGAGVVNQYNQNSKCADAACAVFAPYGTDGINPMTFPSLGVSTEQPNANMPKNGHGQVFQIAIDGVGTTDPELVFIIAGLDSKYCNNYNAKQGITTDYDQNTTLTSIGENPSTGIPQRFTGTFGTTNIFGAGATIFQGKKSFCAPYLPDSNVNRLGVWHVVVAR